MLAIEGLSKHYLRPDRRVDALEGVCLSVPPGEFVAVQGPSGCGKTTLLLAAGGLLRPDAGSVRIDGQDLYRLSPDARARFRASNVGFVFQQFHLIPYLTATENVLAASLGVPGGDAEPGSTVFDPECSDRRGLAEVRTSELIDRLGLSERSSHVPAELSTGERQRVARARALLNRPRHLLGDEPTGNLDRANAEIVIGHLVDFARGGGAVLLVTHSPDVAARAGRTVTLSAGRLISDVG